MLLPPTRPWAYHPRSDLRLHPLAHCDQCGAEARPCGVGDRVEAAIQDRTVLLDDSDDDRAIDLLFLLGARHHSVGDWERAAEYYEAFARHHPSVDGDACTDESRASGTCPDAPAALENAMLFRRALGQTDRALQDAELYERWYGETRIADTARVVAQAGEILEAEGGHLEAAHHWRRRSAEYARWVSPTEALRMQVRVGRARWDAGERRAAARIFRRVVRAWRRGLAEQAAMSAGEVSGADFSRTLEAVGEAAFLLAEVRFEAFRSLSRPTYGGDGSLEDVERWVARRLRPWILRKATALRRAREGYERVAALGVSEWRIAARARTGAMLRLLMDDLASAPVPRALGPGDEHIGGVVVPAEDFWEPALSQLRGPAIRAFEECLRAAVRTRHFGAWSSGCARELTRLDPEGHPADVELRDRRLRVSDSPVLPRPAPAVGSFPDQACPG